MTPPDHRPDEDKIPSAPVPARKERRVSTTHPPQQPGSGPEDLDAPEGRLPHERDEATGMTGGIPSREVRQAYEDVTHGLQDTDKGPPMDRAYQKQKK
ncbi:hypothetical protein ACDW_00590 [Acidovorax sp. DW039]|uniref:hypothetical protein n=1 Tax=Acidovorax sp. DW039 TaxID=3095606 RepID=UPI003086E851|nr:hypothetical protein ACDW_00590 [Acidovorax sp. DW039]